MCQCWETGLCQTDGEKGTFFFFFLITKVFSFVNCVLRFSYGRLFLCPKGVLHFGDTTYISTVKREESCK